MFCERRHQSGVLGQCHYRIRAHCEPLHSTCNACCHHVSGRGRQQGGIGVLSAPRWAVLQGLADEMETDSGDEEADSSGEDDEDLEQLLLAERESAAQVASLTKQRSTPQHGLHHRTY